MARTISRRGFLAATGAAATMAEVAKPAVAQQNPVKIGLMTVKTGGLAAGGVHLEEGITCFLKDRNISAPTFRSDSTRPLSMSMAKSSKWLCSRAAATSMPIN